ncbi:RNA polymerase sporulation sigma factor SigK [Anaerosacchariphilus sp. NSJ-68]|uniref:RNA polymerase sigma factor n=2 Tax=Lachnospiraceae TaxID=186803 RepID=A0A923RMC0_9FIRM|nr:MULTISPECIES: RNA polymerase sporulation sigma factor SigK [Lachnospiraceae]MBC5660114.1 RNA polymerase sporulation sigma factor SigK [Anaerosacchariphilus hominis]MBC5699229.1 RNA polymerase sporulation sigma factor SigK [Roseburia difficilis]
MKTFPQPLEAEEEQYYLQRLKEGDGHARDILVEHNLRLVAHIVKKYQGSGEETEDLISIGTIGLIKAVTTFDNTKGSRLATYAARCVENELLMYFRSKKKTARETSYYDPIGTDKEGNEIHLLDIMESGERDAFSRFCLKEDSRKLYALLGEVLTERERTVLIMRYGLYNRKEYTQREIAQMLGISRSYISRIEKTALQKLREHFLQE